VAGRAFTFKNGEIILEHFGITMINLEQLSVIDKEDRPYYGLFLSWERRAALAVWGMLLGMLTLINITMLLALVQVTGKLPDASLLQIFSRYLKGKDEPREALLHPQEAANRLVRHRKRVLAACFVLAGIAAALSITAAAFGWGVVAMLGITGWVLAANLGLITTVLSSWIRRAGRIWEAMKDELT
jgi:MFS family permease